MTKSGIARAGVVVGSIILAVLSGCAAFLSSYATLPGAVFGVLCVLGCITAAGVATRGIYTAFVESGRKVGRLQKSLARVKKGDISGCIRLREMSIPDGSDGGLAATLTEGRELVPRDIRIPLYMAEGVVGDLTADTVIRENGKYLRQFFEYRFTCSGRDLVITIEDTTTDLHSLFRKSHPFMLADKDRVRVVVDEDGKTVRALRNFEDGCAYTFGVHRGGKIGASSLKVFPYVAAFLLGGAMGQTFFEYGLTPHAVNTMRYAILITTGMLAAVFVLAKGIIRLERLFIKKHGTYHDDIRLISEALDLEKPSGKTRPYLHEL